MTGRPSATQTPALEARRLAYARRQSAIGARAHRQAWTDPVHAAQVARVTTRIRELRGWPLASVAGAHPLSARWRVRLPYGRLTLVASYGWENGAQFDVAALVLNRVGLVVWPGRRTPMAELADEALRSLDEALADTAPLQPIAPRVWRARH